MAPKGKNARLEWPDEATNASEAYAKGDNRFTGTIDKTTVDVR